MANRLGLSNFRHQVGGGRAHHDGSSSTRGTTVGSCPSNSAGVGRPRRRFGRFNPKFPANNFADNDAATVAAATPRTNVVVPLAAASIRRTHRGRGGEFEIGIDDDDEDDIEGDEKEIGDVVGTNDVGGGGGIEMERKCSGATTLNDNDDDDDEGRDDRVRFDHDDDDDEAKLEKSTRASCHDV